MATKLSVNFQVVKQQLWRLKRHLSKRILVIEFRQDALVLAQFQILPSGLKLCGFVREALPTDAVERGVPKDPQLMADLISSLCKEQLLVGHRAIVVLPPQAVHLSSHWLPAGQQIKHLQQSLLEPSSPIQLPFPLEQTDFDVLPNRCLNHARDSSRELWSVLAVASRLSDRILQCLQLGDTECRRIDIKALSLLRPISGFLQSLGHAETALILDFDIDQTHVVVATADGPVQVDRLTAIREYPHADSDAQQNYLPLAEIDLKAFVDDLKALIVSLNENQSLPQQVSAIVVTGVNSAHPDLLPLLSAMVPLKVVGLNLFESFSLQGLDQLSLTESCFMHAIAGAAMGMVPQLQDEQALSLAPLCEVQPTADSSDAVSMSLDALADEQPNQSLIADEALENAMYEADLKVESESLAQTEHPTTTAVSAQEMDDSDVSASDGEEESALTPSSNTQAPVDLQVNLDDSSTWPMIQKLEQPLSDSESAVERKANITENGDNIIISSSRAEERLSSSSLSAASDEPGSDAHRESLSPLPSPTEFDELQGDVQPTDEPAPAMPWLDELTS